MIRTLIQLLKTGNVTQKELFPSLPGYSRGLPMLTEQPCLGKTGSTCTDCADSCPVDAISLTSGEVTLDRGLCIACGGCTSVCRSGTIAPDLRTKVAVASRGELVLSTVSIKSDRLPAATKTSQFRRSLHVREVATGDNASDLEMIASNNPIFDASRFGIHVVASPRFADALVVTGPVPRAMREPLLRCYEAMAEPRLVIAVGSSAISGGLHRGGYADANGVGTVLPVDVYIPGHPPHPWYILHGLILAMGHDKI
jgi:Ni,Fe-hydrogenase III small subunit/ferredoxin